MCDNQNLYCPNWSISRLTKCLVILTKHVQPNVLVDNDVTFGYELRAILIVTTKRLVEPTRGQIASAIGPAWYPPLIPTSLRLATSLYLISRGSAQPYSNTS